MRQHLSNVAYEDCPGCRDSVKEAPEGLYASSVNSREIRVTDPQTGGEKGSKLERYDLIPVKPLASVARVYGKGASKYAERNWEKGYKWSLSYAALQRHANLFWGGQDQDSELQECHLAAVIFHALAMMEWLETHKELDDRAGSK